MNDLEIFLTVVCGVIVVVGAGVERYLNNHVRLTYKEQRVGGKR
jgi:hypothetical protein